MYKPTSCGTSMYTPGVIPEELRDQFGNACELVCVQIPKVYDSCLLRLCLVGDPKKAKPKEGILFDAALKVPISCDVEAIVNPKVKGLVADSFKVISKKPVPGDPDRKIITYQYTLKIKYNEVVGGEVVWPPKTLELTRTETVGPLYCPESKAIIMEQTIPGGEIIDADDEIIKLEIIAKVLDVKIEKEEGPYMDECFAVFTIGIYNIIKCELIVQLVIPAFGFCPPPAPCEQLGEPCEIFNSQLPPEFFPPQLDNFITGPGVDC